MPDAEEFESNSAFHLGGKSISLYQLALSEFLMNSSIKISAQPNNTYVIEMSYLIDQLQTEDNFKRSFLHAATTVQYIIYHSYLGAQLVFASPFTRDVPIHDRIYPVFPTFLFFH